MVFMPALITVSEALKHMLEAFQPVEQESIDLPKSVGRVLAEDIYAGYDLPIFDSSTMDGFALHSRDVSEADREHPVSLNVIADVPAGHPFSGEIKRGQAVRIMTGAPIPDNVDSVIPLEDTNLNQQLAGSAVPEHVQVYRSVQAGDYIRKRGKDARAS